MITKSISTGVQVIFTKNKDGDVLSIANSLGYVNVDGSLVTGTQIIPHTTCNENGMSLPCSIIQTAKLKTYICNLDYGFTFSNTSSFVDELNKYGNDYLVNIDNISTTKVRVNSNNVITDTNRKISFNAPQSQESDPVLGSFIAKMTTDNGRMLQPLTNKFTSIAYSIGKANAMLTGYANLRDYLMLIKQPTLGMANLKNKSLNGDYNINLDSNKITLKVIDVIDGVIQLSCIFLGTMDNLATQSFSPYILLTLKPITLGTQQLPYEIVRFKNYTVFISPLYFGNAKTLTNLKGGVNLLA